MTTVSAPPGSGKTVLLRSWLTEASLAECAAWAPVGPDERDAPPFWLSVLEALRRTTPGSALVQPVTAAPDLDGWEIVERLLADLVRLEDPLWLVIDDVHDLAPQALQQLELLIMRAPHQLRFVLATRHDVPLGLHRLRLEGELTEIRQPDLRFTTAKARELFRVAGVELSEPSLAALQERTEGWAAGLRLAALSLAGHPDPELFAKEFSGSERTVAEYLLAEVLDRQPEPVRRLLLRTSILERVNGELAELLTGDNGGERVLQDLEAANAFVMSLNPARSWFRYHQMFADLLRLALRRTAPEELTGLHLAASRWFATHGFPAEAVRHAQAVGEWRLAARSLADHWPGLYLDGKDATVHELLAAFPPAARATDAELAAMSAGDELVRGSLETAERYLGLAERGLGGVPEGRPGQLRLLLAVVGLLQARQRGNLQAVSEESTKLEAITKAAAATQPGLAEDLRALALISLGDSEHWAARIGDAERHLECGVALARRIGRPYLEFTGLANQAAVQLNRSQSRTVDQAERAVELAQRHGWTADPMAGVACGALGAVLIAQGRADEAEPWIQRAERVVTAEAQPAQLLAFWYLRGVLEQVRGNDAEALTVFGAAEPLARRLAAPPYLIPMVRASLLQALVRFGQVERAGRYLAGLTGHDRDHGEIRVAAAGLLLAQGDPRAAAAELAAVVDGTVPFCSVFWAVMAYVVEAAVRDAVGDAAAAESALERALDRAEPDGIVVPFLLYPLPGLIDRHARHRTVHASLIAEIRSLLVSPCARGGGASSPGNRGSLAGVLPPRLTEPLSGSELRVLRYLPTNLSVPEIARELSVSTNTVKTHVRRLYAKLGTHGRADAVESARVLGLLAPSAYQAGASGPAGARVARWVR